MAGSGINALAGKNATVQIGTVTYKFAKWEIAMKSNLAKITNFASMGFRELLACIAEGTVSLEGTYDANSMPFTTGSTYSVTCTYNGVISLACTAIVESLTPSTDVEDKAMLKVVLQATGTFTASVV